ncbi:LADA_0E13366g1_1 [Lachancea dasiensis]|uniref:LADA_0E13366g1_1 n=1 Tax=Lachancea dasiensis TaxID=1072105 RepID=A0A1G4JG37_9SACH|nr:LADA_0E13366g1_1 [Lachancea dasiensis]
MLISPAASTPAEKFGVVIDAGSSGSRAYVYRWLDSQGVSAQASSRDKYSVPKIHLDKEWSQKSSPGLSSFAKNPESAYSSHIRPLLEFAEQIIPKEHVSSTPVFVQATAGMRLLPKKKRNAILNNLCTDLAHSSNFLLEDCSSQIQVIDGETEGLYGWIGLNYLMGNFDKFNSSELSHSSSGFMDMGGASAQIAFVPSSLQEVQKHDDDMSTITLRSVNGESQTWRVFVSTWLGFGANQARTRYLAQLVNSLPENTNDEDDDDYNTRKLVDPCMLKGSRTEFEYKDVDFEVIGSGNYAHCSKSIFPLLMKDLPCREEPCLFNGVHSPAIDFYNDKFIGTSEFWYTANDVFEVGGEYNFHDFSQKVKEFCETDWGEVQALSDSGKYNGISTKLLLDSCFKANWILSVLHEGFEMPRVGIEVSDQEKPKDDTKDVVAAAVAFQSSDSVDGYELSWTLGKIVMYACSLVATQKHSSAVGIMPSENDIRNFNKKFIAGSINKPVGSDNTVVKNVLPPWYTFLLLFLLGAIFILLGRNYSRKNLPSAISLSMMANKIRAKFTKWKYSALAPGDPLCSLEEGRYARLGRTSDEREGVQVRSRSMLNLDGAGKSSIEHYKMNERTSANGKHDAERFQLRTAFSLADFSKIMNPSGIGKKSRAFS